MSLMLLGYVLGARCGRRARAHMCIPTQYGAGLAAPIDPEATTTEQGVRELVALQNQVLCGYLPSLGLLPFPIGSVFSDMTKISNYLTENEDFLHENATRFSGSVEYTVTVTAEEVKRSRFSDDGSRSLGRDYLMKRRQETIKRRNTCSSSDVTLKTALDAVATFTNNVKKLNCARAPSEAQCAVLIDYQYEHAFLDKLKEVSQLRDAENASFSLVGPSPAYSFAPDFNALEGSGFAEQS